MTRDGKKFYGLDSLRGIGIMGIFLYHMFPSVFRGGFLGVPLFFVISGYLMFLTSEKSWQVKNFHIIPYYQKRVRKIYPALFIMVMALCTYLTLFSREELAGMRKEILSIFCGYNNWWQIHENASYFSRLTNTSFFTHLWFLAVELQIYLIWPFLFLLYKKGCQYLGKGKMPFLFLSLGICSCAWMFFLYTPGEDPSRVYYGTDTISFSIFLGAFLGSIRKEEQPSRTMEQWYNIVFPLCLAITAVLFLSVDGQSAFVYRGGMLFASLVFMLMISAAGSLKPVLKKYFGHPALIFLGKKSYLIYLWHYPILRLMGL